MHGLAPDGELLGLFDRRIGNRRVALRGGYREAEAGLHRRLVKAREEAPGVSGFELRKGIAAIARACGVEAAQIPTQLALKAHRKMCRPRIDGPRKADFYRLALGVEGNPPGLCPAGDRDPCVREFEIHGVENDFARRPPEHELDRDFPVKCRAARGIDFERHVVTRRSHVRREPDRSISSCLRSGSAPRTRAPRALAAGLAALQSLARLHRHSLRVRAGLYPRMAAEPLIWTSGGARAKASLARPKRLFLAHHFSA